MLNTLHANGEKLRKIAKISHKMLNDLFGFGSRQLCCTSQQVLCTYKVAYMYVKAKGDTSLLISLRRSGKSVKP